MTDVPGYPTLFQEVGELVGVWGTDERHGWVP